MAFVSLKHGKVYSVTNNYGDIDTSLMGTGIYYKDTRFLKRYRMKINGQPCIFLKKKQNKGLENIFKLSNGDIHAGDSHYEKMDLEINRSQLIFNEIFYDKIEIGNGSQKRIECTLRFELEATFEDIFEVRGAKRKKRGTLHSPVISQAQATFSYTGLDDLDRKLFITGTEGVSLTESGIEFKVTLEPGEQQQLEIAFQLAIGEENRKEILAYEVALVQAEAELQKWNEQRSKIVTSNTSVNKTINQAVWDLYALATDIGHGHFPVAGIPWFCVPFGRDSILTAIQTLILDPSLAKNTLRTLASVQGQEENSWNEEAPGKILHEMRSGEMANLNEIPFKRYYGSIDATPLYIVLFAETIRWTGDQQLLEELLPSVEKALAYLEVYADLDGDGFIEFHNQSGGGLAVQSWKDSNHSMVHKDGTYSESPMAVVEVQGYLYDAKVKMAELYEYIGDVTKAEKLKTEASILKDNFNELFWMESEKYYALALDKDKRQIQTVTSDPGHALWSEIIPQDKSTDLANKLVSDELFSGWGIRTMSNKEKVYSPVAYHNGTVWPHDNSIAVLGLAKYGFEKHVNQIVRAIFNSAEQFEDNRLPELFCGHGQDTEDSIIPFPVACSPQAWAAGTPFALIQALLGIQVDAFKQVIKLRPTLPQHIDWIEIKDLHAGNGTIDLTLKRTNGQVEVDILKNGSGLKVLNIAEWEKSE